MFECYYIDIYICYSLCVFESVINTHFLEVELGWVELGWVRFFFVLIEVSVGLD